MTIILLCIYLMHAKQNDNFQYSMAQYLDNQSKK